MLYNAAQDGDKSLDELTAEFAHRIDALAEIEGGTVSAWDAVFALINEIDKKDDNKGSYRDPALARPGAWRHVRRAAICCRRTPGDRQDGAWQYRRRTTRRLMARCFSAHSRCSRAKSWGASWQG